MSYLEEDKTSGTQDVPAEPIAEPLQGSVPSQHTAPKAENAPAGEYWVRGQVSNVGQIGQQRPTTTHGYGQGYSQAPQYTPSPIQPQASNPPPYGYPQSYQAYGQNSPYRQPGQHQYSANAGWQQTPPRAPENYQWNFEDYEKAAGGKAGKKRNRGLVVFVISMVCVMAISIAGLAAYGIYGYISGSDTQHPGAASGNADSATAPRNADPLELAQKPQISESLPVGGKMTAEQIAEAVTPSVVGVMQYQPNMYYSESGEGSGIIMSEDGYVITNAHVVRGGIFFKVLLADGTPHDADLVAADDQTDLAVLKVRDVSGLTPAVFGDSSQVKVGEWTFVIGNPGGKLLAGSMTRGIISAVDRELPNDFTIPLIQTDAAINPGNSGGALVNEYGQVIGIPSSKLVAEGFEGICFAIPISEAKPIIDDMVANGRVTGRVMLGIQGKTVDEIDARNNGLMEGIYIADIDPQSSLSNTPIQRFDIITHINGERVTDLASLRKNLDRYQVGDRVTLTIFRAVAQTTPQTFDVEITLRGDTAG